MRYYKDKDYIMMSEGEINLPEITEEEYKEYSAELKKKKEYFISHGQVWEKKRPLTSEEISTLFIKQKINTLEVSDTEALRMKSYYPEWETLIDKTAELNFKFQYNEELYKVIQAHTFQSSWIPGEGTESLYARIDEVHDGSLGDPIPYNGNMALEEGKYYIENKIIYLCNRSTEVPVYNKLSELIDLYVQVALK